ncbi:hypothetical protein Prudu_012398 [Prunus dulcis]|uniref:Nucleolar pre-ribosomal-associated protein 1 C-terminal domain-containing protein n=1 Tax=Prunus dulcis TaxID=3755 RepID=A0A4Y1RCU6_PRUDU|nr:hypothetical protein Prudu_012398 [Prunus dulcis]
MVSFLEVGTPGLLRSVMRQKEMYSVVLRGLGNDDDETVLYVLSTLRNRILVEESSVSPSLRSVLFGSVTLEQLVNVCGRENGGASAELAYSVLVMVCTDPCNGLMSDLKRRLRGNSKRLVDLMKKLKATEIGYHRDLLLAIVNGRPPIAAAYMVEFPYNLEDCASPTWFSAVTLAANVSHDQALLDNVDVQSIMKCLYPRSFSRSTINKGLLHSDFLVKHGTLRVLLEALKLLDSFLGVLNQNGRLYVSESFKQDFQNEVRTLLPDPQVLLTLLSSLSNHSKNQQLKRTAELEKFPEYSRSSVKKLKTDIENKDADIIIGGLNFDPDVALPEISERIVGTSTDDGLDNEKDATNVVAEIWGLDLHSTSLTTLKDAEIYFHCRVLDALKIYLRIMPTVLEGSFEFFMNLLSSPSASQTDLQRSLLSLLVEFVGWSPSGRIPIRTPPLMYKHLLAFMNLLVFSQISDIKDQAYRLAQAAMLSTGAFDRNQHEIASWFLFLPGFDGEKSSVQVLGLDVFTVLAERLGDCSVIDDSGVNNCEWRPLNDLLLFSKSISDQKTCGEMVYNQDVDADEAASAAFSFFLKKAPFHVLFPAIMSIHGPPSEPSKIQDLLLAKLSECPTDCHPISYLRLVLFWLYQIRSSHRIEQLVNFQQLSEICLVLVDSLLSQLLVLNTDSGSSKNSWALLSSQDIQEVAETIFSHPAMIMSFSCPLGCSEDLPKSNLAENTDALIGLSRQRIHILDRHGLDILATTCDYFFLYAMTTNLHQKLKMVLQPHTKRKSYDLFWKMEETSINTDIFEEIYSKEEFGEFLPSSAPELLCLIDDSLLGKAICMLRYHFSLNEDSMKLKKRLKLFNSIFPPSSEHNELIDCDVVGLGSQSLNESLNLSDEAGRDLKDISVDNGSNKEDSSRMQFLNILVGIWQWIVKRVSSVSDSSQKETTTASSSLWRCLEVLILTSILELTREISDGLTQLQSIPFLEQLMKSALLYRFEDPTTLKTVRDGLTFLSEGKFSRVPYLQLLLAHSQFAPTIHSVYKSSDCSIVGAFSRPLSGILRSLVFPSTNKNVIDGKCNLETTNLYVKQLEVHQYGFDFAKDLGINLRELHLLLLSSYGSTLSEIDEEIYNLMRSIESIDVMEPVNFAGMDHLWGNAVLKIEKERTLAQNLSYDGMTDTEAVKERRRSQFRENLVIDPKLCASTVLYFPYDRVTSEELLSLNKFQKDNFDHMHVLHSPDVENVERYNPVFILRFSIHSLAEGYIEPLEFAGLGLLGIAFMSMSSPDDRIRRLGYDSLGRFKNALESILFNYHSQKSPKRKGVRQIQLLLTYVQNAIEEPWQRIPSVNAIFAAETSLILLDPSHDHYAALTKLLMRSSRLNVKNILFFSNFFWSSSINFKAERLWILRLVYAGLNFEDDAKIYMKNSVLETLMSFYVSPISDDESKELILQVVKKAVKLHKMARYLLAVVSELYGFDKAKSCCCQSNSGNNNITLKISQKRRIYQPHFILSIEGSYNIYEAVKMCDNTRSCDTAELGLHAILMSAPPSREKLSSFLMWAISAAVEVESAKMLQHKESHQCFAIIPEEELQENSLISKLLRWLTASVILGKLDWKSNDLDPEFPKMLNIKTLQSLMDHVESACRENSKSSYGCEEILASAILYLQQLAGTNYKMLPSVTTALSLLLSDASIFAGFLCNNGSVVKSLWSKVGFPAEANPAWRCELTNTVT